MASEPATNYWKRLRRRSLLKGSVVAGIGGIGLLAVGCGDDSTTKGTSGPNNTAVPTLVPKIDGFEYLQNAPDNTLAPKPGGVLKYGTYIRAATLDPIKSSSFEAANIWSPVYSKLFRSKFGSELTPYNPWKQEIVPDLATGFEQPTAGQYTIKIRQGVKWQNKAPVNGRAFTADDVKFALDSYAASPEFKNSYLPIDKVEVTAPDTISVKLTGPKNFLIQALAEARVVMLPKEVAAADGDFSKNAVGTGPFVLDQYTPNTSAVYKKNTNYYVPNRPYLDGIEYVPYADEATARANFIADKFPLGRGDGLGAPDQYKVVMDARKDAVAFRLQSRWQTNVFHLALRADKKPFDDPRIITAMSKGFDRTVYAKQAFQGLTGNVLGPYPWVDWYDKEPDLGNAYKFDPQAAKQLLSAAGITGTLDIPFEYANYGQSLVDQVQYMAEQLKAIGINVQLNLLDVVPYQTKYVSGLAENGLVGFIGTSPRYAPLSALSIWHSSATPNRYHIKDPIIDSSLDKVTTSLDKNEQRAAFQAFENQLATRPYIMQVAEAPTHFFHSPKIHNYLPNEYHDVAGWGGNSFETIWMDA